MAGGEHQSQQVVADVVVQRGLEARLVSRFLLEARASSSCSRSSRVPAQPVDRATLGRASARPGVARDACRRPLLQRGDQRVVRQVLGRARSRTKRISPAIARRLEPPHRLDGGMGSGWSRSSAVNRPPARNPRPRTPAGSRRRRRRTDTGSGSVDPFDHSAFDRHCKIQKPAISSLVSANGPSTTVRYLPLK